MELKGGLGSTPTKVVTIRAEFEFDVFGTINGLSSRFSTVFPDDLREYISDEQFSRTMRQINRKLQIMHIVSAGFQLIGVLLCLFTFGASMVLSNLGTYIAVSAVEKILTKENSRIYEDLGLHWALLKDPNSFQYILRITVSPRFIIRHL